MKKIMIPIAALVFLVLSSSFSWAGGANWNNHAFPLTFLFGNHIDSHQQTRLTKEGDFSVTFTSPIRANTHQRGIPWHITAELKYQPVAYGFVQDLFLEAGRHPAVDTFKSLFETANIRAETIASISTTVQ